MKDGFTKITPDIFAEGGRMRFNGSNKVIDIGISDNKELITLREGCDKYFDMEMNKTQLSTLIFQLADIRNSMIDTK